MSDYIDRNIAIARLTALEVQNPTATMCDAKRVLADMTAADVAPIVHSEWVEDDYGFYHCRKCGYEWDESEYRTYYCPDCGANMEVEK